MYFGDFVVDVVVVVYEFGGEECFGCVVYLFGCVLLFDYVVV